MQSYSQDFFRKMRYLKTFEVRELDRLAQDRFGLPGLLLMEHASLGLARYVTDRAGMERARIALLCGKGNNGGDGFAAARHLHNFGHAPEVLLLGRLDDLKPASDAAVNAQIAVKMGIPFREYPDGVGAAEQLKDGAYSVYLDAVFGTGLSTPLRGIYPALFETINRLDLPFIAVDVPSGLNSDTGEPMGAAIRARETVTFAFAKRGFQNEHSEPYCGEITVAGIGLPREVMEAPEKFL
jgi:NAD(P)H-hydrate epimerase